MLTGAPVIAIKLPFLEDHLIIRLCDVGQVKVWLCDEQ